MQNHFVVCKLEFEVSIRFFAVDYDLAGFFTFLTYAVSPKLCRLKLIV